jgi:uncharacterized protein (TIGR03083 family)
VQRDAYLAQLSDDGTLIADIAGQSALDDVVHSCPGWVLRDLVTHLGGVHRWAASIVANAMPHNDEVTGDRVGTGPDDADLLDWFREGHEALVAALRAAPSDLQCFTFLPAPTPLLFWARRQAHETAIHRADAQTARGQITPFNSEFARDGIEELLFGFAARPRPAITPGTMLLKPDDLAVSWLVSFGDHGVSASVAEAATDATVVGHASDIYLWLWNRPSVAEVRGDHAVAARWRDVRVRWS